MMDTRFNENNPPLYSGQPGEPPPHQFTIIHDWGRTNTETHIAMREVIDWCTDQFGPQGARWGVSDGSWTVIFAWPREASLFKLRWT